MKLSKESNTLDMNFEKYCQDLDGRVILVFYGSWCNQSAALMGTLDLLNFDSGTRIGKIDVDAYPNLTNSLNIERLPTIIMIDNGLVLSRVNGLVPIADLSERLGL